MTYEGEEQERVHVYTYEQQYSHKRYLDTLKTEFYKIYSNPFSYTKSIEEFDLIKTLGCGAYGVVLLVRDKSTFVYHAMKVIEKKDVVNKKQIKQLFQEKKILQSSNFAFVLTLDYCCKDNVYIYLFLPYEAGGELFTLIRKSGGLAEPLAQFYTAQIVLAIEYLHHCCVIHRDVKPENILITETGYIRLADFGFCKILKTRTWTLCGTPEYLAPEIILSKGYSYAADWWSVGVLIFEMNAGYPPFYHSEPMKLYEKVLQGHFKTPESISPQCKSLVKSLLQVDHTKRLGSLKAGVFDIKKHSWFLGIDWVALCSKRMNAPFLPTCQSIKSENEADVKLLKSSKCQYEEEFENF